MNRPNHQGLGMGVGVGMRKAEAHIEQHGRWVGSMTLEILPFSPDLGDMAKTGITGAPLFPRQGRGQGGRCREPEIYRDSEGLQAAGSLRPVRMSIHFPPAFVNPAGNRGAVLQIRWVSLAASGPECRGNLGRNGDLQVQPCSRVQREALAFTERTLTGQLLCTKSWAQEGLE